MAVTADVRDHILDVAGRLFDQHGVHAVSMAQVADVAGCGRSGLRRHFSTKDALVLARLERFAALREASAAEVVAGLERVPSASLVALAREVGDRVSEPAFHGCALRAYVLESRGVDDEPGRFAVAEIRRSRRRIDALVDRLGTDDPDLLAAQIWLVVEGLYASVPYPGREAAASAAVGLVQDLLAAA